ncbi:hypothetical protein, partial [Sphingomonas sp.]|uniref:hypothetical protein n=1 Tax=Sphingomonas sp. TaxID=28214 RepID=UPI003D6D6CC1
PPPPRPRAAASTNLRKSNLHPLYNQEEYPSGIRTLTNDSTTCDDSGFEATKGAIMKIQRVSVEAARQGLIVDDVIAQSTERRASPAKIMA